MSDENALREPEPFLVEPGWERSDFIRRSLVMPGFRLLYYPDGRVRFEHRCERWDDFSQIVAPLLVNHTVTRGDSATHKDQPTVTPSIDCPDCDLHGFIVDGWWRR